MTPNKYVWVSDITSVNGMKVQNDAMQDDPKFKLTLNYMVRPNLDDVKLEV